MMVQNDVQFALACNSPLLIMPEMALPPPAVSQWDPHEPAKVSLGLRHEPLRLGSLTLSTLRSTLPTQDSPSTRTSTASTETPEMCSVHGESSFCDSTDSDSDDNHMPCFNVHSLWPEKLFIAPPPGLELEQSEAYRPIGKKGVTMHSCAAQLSIMMKQLTQEESLRGSPSVGMKDSLPATMSATTTEDLKAIIHEIPKLADGSLTSVGSMKHTERGCRPCGFAFTKLGCHNGVLCNFCHIPHKSMSKQKLVRTKRQRFKKAEARLLAEIASVPDTPEKDDLQLQLEQKLQATRDHYTKFELIQRAPSSNMVPFPIFSSEL